MSNRRETAEARIRRMERNSYTVAFKDGNSVRTLTNRKQQKKADKMMVALMERRRQARARDLIRQQPDADITIQEGTMV